MSGYDAVVHKKSKFHMFEDGQYVTYVSGPSDSGNYRFQDDQGYKQYVLQMNLSG